jgi:tripartite-type tricarboxylate transporter receptor subunit TctC
MRRSVLTGLTVGLGSLLAPALARAQSNPAFPTKPVRFIVALGPGSGADTGTRFVAERIGKVTGQPAVVENRTGGDGVIAVQNLLASPADGHTIMYITPSPMVLTPLLRDVPYDPLRDIRPVAYISRAHHVFVTGANSRFKTLNDVLTEARAKPNTVKMSNYGHHYRIGGLSLQRVTGAEFIHVAYKGAGQANNDVISGDIDVAITDTGGAMPLIEGGRLRPLAVTSPGRHPFLPNVPGMKELGLNYELMVWTGFEDNSLRVGVEGRRKVDIKKELSSSYDQLEAHGWVLEEKNVFAISAEKHGFASEEVAVDWVLSRFTELQETGAYGFIQAASIKHGIDYYDR